MSSAAAGDERKSFSRPFVVGIALNLAYVFIEAGYGVVSNSMALIADAGHNLSDVLGLGIAWGAAIASKRRPTKRFTYGLRGSSILAALLNAIVLLIAMGAIGWEAGRRFSSPSPVAGQTVMIVAGIGIFVNAITAWLLSSGRKGDLNIRGAFAHGRRRRGLVGSRYRRAGHHLYRLDVARPAGESWHRRCDRVGDMGHSARVRRDGARLRSGGHRSRYGHHHLSSLPGVTSIHDPHIWAVSTTETALTVHLVPAEGGYDDRFLADLRRDLRERFGIDH